MRVYGSSPLFSYVELIFRSKRLFIVSIILATLATTGFYLSRTKTYTATMVVQMTGQKTMGANDDTQRGSVAWKLSILQIMFRYRENIQKAMDLAHLLDGKSPTDVAVYCKKVSESITYDPAGNFLGITCRWPGSASECEQILNAFYLYYNQKVMGELALVSTTRTDLLTKLLKDYHEKHHTLEEKVGEYEVKNLAFKPGYNFVQANQDYLQSLDQVKRLQEALQSANKQRDSISAELAHTQPTTQDSITYKGNSESPEMTSAVTTRDAALQALKDLQVNFTDANPKVKAAQEKYDQAKAHVEQLEKTANAKAGQKRTASDIQSIKENANPIYQSLKSQMTEQNLNIAKIQTDLTNAQNSLEKAKQRVQMSPAEALRYRTMTSDLGLYAQIEEQLRADLEKARLEEKREQTLSAKDMSVEVPPTAEMEQGGARSALLLAAGPLLGLIVAFSFSLLAESLDHSLRTPQEVETFLNKPVLAVLPRLDTNKKTAQRQLGAGDDKNNRPSLPS